MEVINAKSKKKNSNFTELSPIQAGNIFAIKNSIYLKFALS